MLKRWALRILTPHCGASLILEGIADFTHVPPSSRLQSDTTGATLMIDMENRPCVLPGREIEVEHEGFGAKFKPPTAACVAIIIIIIGTPIMIPLKIINSSISKNFSLISLFKSFGRSKWNMRDHRVIAG